MLRCWCQPLLPDSDVVECMSMMKGLKFARDMLFLNLTDESNYANVIDVLKEPEHQRSYFSSISEDCKSFFSLSNFNYLDLVHVRREANQATHYLAKFAIYSLTDFLWMEEIPHCIAVVVTLDVLPSFG
jgi:hypothetical protein